MEKSTAKPQEQLVKGYETNFLSLAIGTGFWCSLAPFPMLTAALSLARLLLNIGRRQDGFVEETALLARLGDVTPSASFRKMLTESLNALWAGAILVGDKGGVR